MIPLKNKGGTIIDYALIDDADWDLVKQFVWHKGN
jgi:hypothetical protein